MPFTLVGFTESQDTGGNLTAVAALADPHIRVNGDDVIVPELDKVIGAYAAGTTITRAQLRSPSLRRVVNYELAPLNVGSPEPLSPAPGLFFPRNPLPLRMDEALNAFVAEGAAAAEQEVVLIWLADGPVAPQAGEIFTVRVSGAVTLVAFAWSNGGLTFDQSLPVGRYAIVGARFSAAGLIGFRFVFVGGIWRPGGLGVDAASDLVPEGQRNGGWGTWGEFDHNTPPTVDFLSVSADTSEVGELDLVKLS